MHTEKHQLGKKKRGTLQEREGEQKVEKEESGKESEGGEIPVRRDSKGDLRIMIRRLCVAHFKDLITTAY